MSRRHNNVADDEEDEEQPEVFLRHRRPSKQQQQQQQQRNIVDDDDDDADDAARNNVEEQRLRELLRTFEISSLEEQEKQQQELNQQRQKQRETAEQREHQRQLRHEERKRLQRDLMNASGFLIDDGEDEEGEEYVDSSFVNQAGNSEAAACAGETEEDDDDALASSALDVDSVHQKQKAKKQQSAPSAASVSNSKSNQQQQPYPPRNALPAQKRAPEDPPKRSAAAATAGLQRRNSSIATTGVVAAKSASATTSTGATSFLPARKPTTDATSTTAPTTAVNVEKKSKAKKKPRIPVAHVAFTKYAVVKRSFTELGYKLLVDDGVPSDSSDLDSATNDNNNEAAPPRLCYDDMTKFNFNVVWSDTVLPIDKLTRLEAWQRANHFPGMSVITRKVHLAQTMGAMKKTPTAGHYFSFVPATFALRSERTQFQRYFSSIGGSKSGKFFILKPNCGAQGKGIVLSKDPLSAVDFPEDYICQEYVARPLLIEGKKFDLRVYVLVTSMRHLTLRVFDEGLVRMCSENYVKPTTSNADNTCVHLTNYAVNKKSSNFVKCVDPEGKGDTGSKRDFAFFTRYLRETCDVDPDKVWAVVHELIVRTLLAAQPKVQRTYSTCFPLDAPTGEAVGGRRCFEILGFDVLIDDQFQPWLMEVNHTPSFATDSPLDLRIKHSLIKEALEIIGVQPKPARKKQVGVAMERLTRGMTGRKQQQQQSPAVLPMTQTCEVFNHASTAAGATNCDEQQQQQQSTAENDNNMASSLTATDNPVQDAIAAWRASEDSRSVHFKRVYPPLNPTAQQLKIYEEIALAARECSSTAMTAAQEMRVAEIKNERQKALEKQQMHLSKAPKTKAQQQQILQQQQSASAAATTSATSGDNSNSNSCKPSPTTVPPPASSSIPGGAATAARAAAAAVGRAQRAARLNAVQELAPMMLRNGNNDPDEVYDDDEGCVDDDQQQQNEIVLFPEPHPAQQQQPKLNSNSNRVSPESLGEASSASNPVNNSGNNQISITTVPTKTFVPFPNASLQPMNTNETTTGSPRSNQQPTQQQQQSPHLFQFAPILLNGNNGNTVSSNNSSPSLQRRPVSGGGGSTARSHSRILGATAAELAASASAAAAKTTRVSPPTTSSLASQFVEQQVQVHQQQQSANSSNIQFSVDGTNIAAAGRRRGSTSGGGAAALVNAVQQQQTQQQPNNGGNGFAKLDDQIIRHKLRMTLGPPKYLRLYLDYQNALQKQSTEEEQMLNPSLAAIGGGVALEQRPNGSHFFAIAPQKPQAPQNEQQQLTTVTNASAIVVRDGEAVRNPVQQNQNHNSSSNSNHNTPAPDLISVRSLMGTVSSNSAASRFTGPRRNPQQPQQQQQQAELPSHPQPGMFYSSNVMKNSSNSNSNTVVEASGLPAAQQQQHLQSTSAVIVNRLHRAQQPQAATFAFAGSGVNVAAPNAAASVIATTTVYCGKPLQWLAHRRKHNAGAVEK